MGSQLQDDDDNPAAATLVTRRLVPIGRRLGLASHCIGSHRPGKSDVTGDESLN